MKIHYCNGESEKIITGIVSIMPKPGDPLVAACVSQTGKSYRIHMTNIKYIYDDSLPNPALGETYDQEK